MNDYSNRFVNLMINGWCDTDNYETTKPIEIIRMSAEGEMEQGRDDDNDCEEIPCNRRNASKEEPFALYHKTQLYKLIEKENWNLVTQRLQSNPEEASSWLCVHAENGNDTKRMLPIHAACLPIYTYDIDGKQIICGTKAKLSIIQELLKIFPDGAKMKDEKGRLPLHLAASNGASTIILEALIEAYPKGMLQKDSTGRRPVEHVRDSNAWNKERVMKFFREHNQKRTGME